MRPSRTQFRSTNSKLRCISLRALVLLIAVLLMVSLSLTMFTFIVPSTPNQSDRDGAHAQPRDYGTHPIQEKPWGTTYSPLRIWCMVPTLYPRNTNNIQVCLCALSRPHLAAHVRTPVVHKRQSPKHGACSAPKWCSSSPTNCRSRSTSATSSTSTPTT